MCSKLDWKLRKAPCILCPLELTYKSCSVLSPAFYFCFIRSDYDTSQTEYILAMLLSFRWLANPQSELPIWLHPVSHCVVDCILTLQWAESGGLSTSKLSAPQTEQRSGSHSLTAIKQGHCLVEQCALHLQPGNLFLHAELQDNTAVTNLPKFYVL